MGFQKGAILQMIVLEGLIQTLAGGLLGCLVVEAIMQSGMIGSLSTCGLSVEISTGVWSWAGALVGIAAAGTLGSFIPAWNLSRIDIVEAIRRED
jgi:ABC-type antimicrobial peptide transport system permease subunit